MAATATSFSSLTGERLLHVSRLDVCAHAAEITFCVYAQSRARRSRFHFSRRRVTRAALSSPQVLFVRHHVARITICRPWRRRVRRAVYVQDVLQSLRRQPRALASGCFWVPDAHHPNPPPFSSSPPSSPPLRPPTSPPLTAPSRMPLHPSSEFPLAHLTSSPRFLRAIQRADARRPSRTRCAWTSPTTTETQTTRAFTT